MPTQLSALFERERAPVAQRIRAADFGLSRPMRCSWSVGGGAKRAELSALLLPRLGEHHQAARATPAHREVASSSTAGYAGSVGVVRLKLDRQRLAYRAVTAGVVVVVELSFVFPHRRRQEVEGPDVNRPMLGDAVEDQDAADGALDLRGWRLGLRLRLALDGHPRGVIRTRGSRGSIRAVRQRIACSAPRPCTGSPPGSMPEDRAVSDRQCRGPRDRVREQGHPLGPGV